MSRADQRVLRWFGHLERMDEYRMARIVLMAEVSGGRVLDRPRLGWFIIVTLKNIFAHVFYNDGWCEGGLGQQRNNAVGINCKNGATTENQGAGVKYKGQGVHVG